MQGRADRVKGSGTDLTVVDLKTGLLEDGVAPHHHRQLLMYAWLWDQQHDVWPLHGAIEGLDGVRRVVALDRSEGEDLVAEALSRVDAFNAATGFDGLEQLANPTADACRYCDYRGACAAFLRAVEPDWEGGGRTFAGEASQVQAHGAVLNVTVAMELGNFVAPSTQVNLIGLPLGIEVSAGQWVSVVDAASTASPVDFRPRWQTILWSWDERPAP